jgi:regulator of replication initiation timing
MSVKKVVEEYQQENSHLKIQNSEFFEQNEILKMSYEKLEIKLEEMGQHEETLRNEIAAHQQKIAIVEDALKRKTEE